jgi:hypothetical protein
MTNTIPLPNIRRRTFLRGAVGVLAGGVMAKRASGAAIVSEDCLNRDLSTAAGDALVIAKHSGGHARVRYLTLYAVPAEKRIAYIAAISTLCHQLSHAGVTLQPQKITDSVWRLDLNQYDPGNVGWEKAWEEIVQHDRRYHYGDVVPDAGGAVFVGSTIEVRCSDGKFYPAKVVLLDGSNYFFEINGRRFHSARNTVRLRNAVAAYSSSYGSWVDYSAAKLLEEITGSKGAILDGREFAYFASRTATIYTFRNTAKTLNDWLKQWGEFESRGFGKIGVRGSNLDVSNVTFTVRGLERRRLPVWVTFDQSKTTHDLTEERDPFALPDRTNKFDATEALAITPNGALDTAIFDGAGNRVDAVPAGVALDTSYGTRELRPGLSCWSCHSQSVGGEETNGFLSFVDDQTATRDYTKDPKLAAELASYYGNASQLDADMDRDRDTFARGCRESSGGQKCSQVFETLNELCNEVELAHVDAERACRELCLTVDGSPEETLAKWLNGTTTKSLVALMDGRSVHYQRFRLALNESLNAVHQRRIFAK